MRVLIIGGGGREHALAWKLAQSPLLTELYCVPGNAGISTLARTVNRDPAAREELRDWDLEKKIDLTVVGPEAPLVGGLADSFRERGLKVFGPGREAARLEGARFGQRILWSITVSLPPILLDQPEAAHRYLRRRPGPVVVKADGLAAGKVTVADNLEEAEQALTRSEERALGRLATVVIEEKLEGEVTVLAITDGRNLLSSSAQDHKAVGEGDRGPNTAAWGLCTGGRPDPELPTGGAAGI